jgi:hypothetical protein
MLTVINFIFHHLMIFGGVLLFDCFVVADVRTVVKIYA